MKKIKIKVKDNPVLSKFVQEHAFSLGIYWICTGDTISCLNSETIFIENGFMSTGHTGNFKEISPIDFFKMTKDDFEDELICMGKPIRFDEGGVIRIFSDKYVDEIEWDFYMIEKIYLKAKGMKNED